MLPPSIAETGLQGADGGPPSPPSDDDDDWVLHVQGGPFPLPLPPAGEAGPIAVKDDNTSTEDRKPTAPERKSCASCIKKGVDCVVVPGYTACRRCHETKKRCNPVASASARIRAADESASESERYRPRLRRALLGDPSGAVDHRGDYLWICTLCPSGKPPHSKFSKAFKHVVDMHLSPLMVGFKTQALAHHRLLAGSTGTLAQCKCCLTVFGAGADQEIDFIKHVADSHLLSVQKGIVEQANTFIQRVQVL